MRHITVIGPEELTFLFNLNNLNKSLNKRLSTVDWAEVRRSFPKFKKWTGSFYKKPNGVNQAENVVGEIFMGSIAFSSRRNAFLEETLEGPFEGIKPEHTRRAYLDSVEWTHCKRQRCYSEEDLFLFHIVLLMNAVWTLSSAILSL